MGAGLAVLAAGSARAAEPTPLAEIEVVGRAPDAVSPSVRTITEAQIQAGEKVDLQGALAQRLPGAVLPDSQGNPFTRDLQLRGFDASPTAGRPQGLAVYQGGARINEPFGDTVNWDMLPEIAVSQADLQTQNPAFGLNALAGALSLRMKSGFDGDSSLSVRGGSFGRVFGAAELSKTWGETAGYLALEGGKDDGWRLHSPSQVARGYGDLAWRGDKVQARLSISAADNRLSAIGPTPVALLLKTIRATYTWPQTTHNAGVLVSASGRWQASRDWSLSANLYMRRFDQTHVDGNDGDFEGCSSTRGNPLFSTLCLQDDAFPSAIRPPKAAFQVQTLAGTPVFCPPTALPCAGIPFATIDRTRTGSTLWGGGIEASRQAPVAGLGNSLTLGLNLTTARARFSSDSELGVIGADLQIAPNPQLPATGQKIKTAGAFAYTPVAVSAAIDTQGLYLSDTLVLTERWSATFAGRWNGADIRLQDLTGSSPAVTGSHRYERFNPAVTIAYQATPAIRVYGGYAEANRAPTPLELGCSDPDRPCLLEAAMVADPPLKQVVARSFEAGIKAHGLWGGKLSLEAGAYTIDSDDDILAMPSRLIGRGSYANVPRTRRRGLELAAEVHRGRITSYANFGVVQATYRFSGALPSPNSPFADAQGLVHVVPGDHIGGVAPQTIKLGTDVQLTRSLTVGAEAMKVTSAPLVGDEHGQDFSPPGYGAINLHADWRVGRASLFIRVNNLMDNLGGSYATYYDTSTLSALAGTPILNARAAVPLAPRSLEGGFTLRW